MGATAVPLSVVLAFFAALARWMRAQYRFVLVLLLAPLLKLLVLGLVVVMLMLVHSCLVAVMLHAGHHGASSPGCQPCACPTLTGCDTSACLPMSLGKLRLLKLRTYRATPIIKVPNFSEFLNSQSCNLHIIHKVLKTVRIS